MLRSRMCAALVALAVLLMAGPSLALFHVAVIDEVMTSNGGNSNLQFVQIRTLAAFQTVVGGSVLTKWDGTGTFQGTVLTVPGNITNSPARWIMATSQLGTAAGITPYFTFPAGSLPTGSGMVCWGKPTTASNPNDPGYVDCLAYGNCSAGACSNSHTTGPTSLNPDGHSLRRVTAGMSFDNATDFQCASPATPINNSAMSGSLTGSVPCPVAMPAAPRWAQIALGLLLVATVGVLSARGLTSMRA